MSEAYNFVAKRKREEDKAKKESQDKGISNYFTKGPVAVQPKAKVLPMALSPELLLISYSLSKQKQMTISWPASLAK